VFKENNRKSKVAIRTLILLASSLFFSFISTSAFSEASEPVKSIENLFKHAMLAEASYVKFDEGESSSTFEKKLEDSDQYGDKQKRAIFTGNFDLLHHEPDRFLTGFSATVFKNKDTQKAIFASRGTAGLFGDFLDANINDIVLSGAPQNQAKDLYNYVQRLKALDGGNLKSAFS